MAIFRWKAPINDPSTYYYWRRRIYPGSSEWSAEVYFFSVLTGICLAILSAVVASFFGKNPMLYLMIGWVGGGGGYGFFWCHYKVYEYRRSQRDASADTRG